MSQIFNDKPNFFCIYLEIERAHLEIASRFYFGVPFEALNLLTANWFLG